MKNFLEEVYNSFLNFVLTTLGFAYLLFLISLSLVPLAILIYVVMLIGKGFGFIK